MELKDAKEGSQGDNGAKDEMIPSIRDCEPRIFNLFSRIVNQSAVAPREYNGTNRQRAVSPYSLTPRALRLEKRSSLKMWGGVSPCLPRKSPQLLVKFKFHQWAEELESALPGNTNSTCPESSLF